MRHFLLICDAAPDLPTRAFRKAFGRNAPATLEGGKGGGAPSAPDPFATAAATTQTNQDTAAYNKALNLNNYSNPFGGQNTYMVGRDPSTFAPIYQTDITANPQLQGAMNGLFGQIGNSAGINQGALSGLSGLQSQYGDLNRGISALAPQMSGLSGQYSGLSGQYSGLSAGVGGLASGLSSDAAQQAQRAGQNAAYGAQTQYLDPQFSQQEESLKASLANQGLTPGSQAYNNAMLNFGQQKQRAYSDAANQSILTGSQIGTQNWQNQLAGVNARSNLYGQQAGMLGQQGGLLGQQAGLLGQQAGLFGQIGQNLQGQAGMYGQQVGIGQAPYSNLQTIASMIPGYSGPAAAGAQPADIGGYMNNQYQGQLSSYNARQASANSTMGTVGSLIGAAAIAAF